MEAKRQVENLADWFGMGGLAQLNYSSLLPARPNRGDKGQVIFSKITMVNGVTVDRVVCQMRFLPDDFGRLWWVAREVCWCRGNGEKASDRHAINLSHGLSKGGNESVEEERWRLLKEAKKTLYEWFIAQELKCRGEELVLGNFQAAILENRKSEGTFQLTVKNPFYCEMSVPPFLRHAEVFVLWIYDQHGHLRLDEHCVALIHENGSATRVLVYGTPFGPEWSDYPAREYPDWIYHFPRW